MTNQSYRILIPIIFGTTILFALFGLKPLYTNYMDANSMLDTVEASKDTKQKTLDDLLAMRQSLESATGVTEFTEKVKRLAKPWNEADIMASIMLNDYTRSTDILSAPISITSISLDKGRQLPSGLSLGTVQLALNGKSVDDIIDYLTFLTSSSPYIYTFNNIALPISAPSKDDFRGVSLSIGLGVYYYE